jgi:hypothetical protein
MKTARPQRKINIRMDGMRRIFFNLKISPDMPAPGLSIIAIFKISEILIYRDQAPSRTHLKNVFWPNIFVGA